MTGRVIPYTGKDAPFVGDHDGCTYDAPHKHAPAVQPDPDRANLELRPDDEPEPPPPRWPALVVAFCAGVLALAVVLVVAR